MGSTSFRVIVQVGMFLAVVGLVACAPAAPPSPTAAPAAPKPAPTSAPAKEETKPAAKATEIPASKPAETKPAAPVPAKTDSKPAAAPSQRYTVRLAQTGNVLAFAPTYIARDRFFAEEGIDIQFELVTGVTGLQALMGDSVDVTVGASNEFLNALDRGVDLVTFSSNIAMTSDLIASTAWMKKQGVTPSLPLQEKFKALKGSVVGITTPGSLADSQSRWMLKKAGLDPATDATLVSITAAGARMGALKQGQIDVYFSSPPEGPQIKYEGYGDIFIGPDEIAEWKNYVHEIVYVKRDYANKNQDLMIRLARAFAKSNNFVLDNLEDSKRILAKYFDKVDPSVLAASVESTRGKVFRDGRMTEEAWKNTGTFFLDAGVVKKMPDVKEGGLWTNQYIKMALGS
jgi:NitT/TauT family transport system substrate-binding protein